MTMESIDNKNPKITGRKPYRQGERGVYKSRVHSYRKVYMGILVQWQQDIPNKGRQYSSIERKATPYIRVPGTV